ncbi:3'-5' exoribonuclease YhaM family protein [Paracidobacterium acidisoli]|uniref:HD domain-containing protein n=1 Tax=Paracidobacterium acidisoli TaxID=2303751 RepID=A0A372IKN7_9BACT|nr:HD domain-containing protein [Paracidobacterium acidisoli]MBT9332862.1 HD domain-containing protein [Paracidobacterium acidisoli]
MKHPMIADLARYDGQEITGFFVAGSKQVRNRRDGAPYLALSLCDATGQLEARLWEADGVADFAAGDVVKIQAQVGRYQDKLQMVVKKLRPARPEEYDLGDFVPKTGRDVEELWAELNSFVASFADPDLQALLRAFLDDEEIAGALREAPAAKSMHHAWIGGLLEHVVSLLGICRITAQHYPEVNRDLLLTGAFLHDIGKLRELRWGTSFDYTIEGQLLGHITIGIGLIEKKIAALPDFPEAKRILVEHLVLSHHGRYEYGSPKLPMIPEAILLHYLDDMDAKMQTVRSELTRNEAAGRPAGQVTDWVRALDRPLLDSKRYLAANMPVPDEVGYAGGEPVKTASESDNVLPFED